LAPAVLKTRKKKELETEFQLFWNNINQKVMDYLSTGSGKSDLPRKGIPALLS
jgi:hypothetical protein